MPAPHIVSEFRENDKAMLKAMDKCVKDLIEAAGAAELIGYTPLIRENRRIIWVPVGWGRTLGRRWSMSGVGPTTLPTGLLPPMEAYSLRAQARTRP